MINYGNPDWLNLENCYLLFDLEALAFQKKKQNKICISLGVKLFSGSCFGDLGRQIRKFIPRS